MKLRVLLLLLALLPLAACAASKTEAPVEGTDYLVNPEGRPLAPRPGSIEVVEVFGYTCPHCAHFEPQLQQWRAKQPKDVRVDTLPAPFGGYWIPYARAYYAAEQLGVLSRSHSAVFEALHGTGELPIQNASPQEIGAFYARYGVDAGTFADTMMGPQVEARLRAAHDFAVRAQISGTPSMVVNGRYTVPVGEDGFEQMLKTVDWLVARERAQAGK